MSREGTFFHREDDLDGFEVARVDCTIQRSLLFDVVMHAILLFLICFWFGFSLVGFFVEFSRHLDPIFPIHNPVKLSLLYALNSRIVNMAVL